MRFALLLGLFSAFLCSSAHAEWTTPGRWTGLTADCPPYNFLKEDTEIGYSTELIQGAFKRLKTPLELKTWPWARSYRAAMATKNSFVFSAIKSKESEGKFKWVGPINIETVHLVALKDSKVPKVENIEELKNYKVAGLLEDEPTTYLQSLGFKVDTLPHGKEKMELLKKGDMSIMPATDLAIKNFQKTHKVEFKKVAKLYQAHYYYAFNIETSDVFIAKLNETLVRMKEDGTVDKLRRKYEMD